MMRMRVDSVRRTGTRAVALCGAAVIWLVTLLAAGCGTTGASFGAKVAPVDLAALQQNADALLDYIEGKRAALPKDMFASGPLASGGEDLAQQVLATADRMRERDAQLSPLETSRMLGEDNRGYLSLRDEEALKNADQKNDLQRLMAAENDDRKEFYRAVAHAAEDSGLTLTRVERMYAARRLARAASGAVVQLPPDGEDFVALKASPRGTALGDACRPGGWVTLP